MPTATLKAALLTLALATLPAMLHAQAIPDELVRKNDIGDADKQAIRAFVDANKAGLTGTAADVKRSREALLLPLEKPGVTVQFRSAYASTLVESAAIDKLAADKDRDLVATNALRLAGQAATGNTINIVNAALTDPRPTVRYAATVAARSAFNAARSNPALSPEQVAASLRALAQVVATDTAKEPVDGAVQAIAAARAITGVRSIAVERLADAAGKRALLIAKSDQPQDLAPLLRAASAIQEEMIDAGTLTTEARAAAAAFAGQALIAVKGQWKEGEPTEPATALVKVADAVLSLLDQHAGPARTVRLAGSLSDAKREQFDRDLNAIIGPAGMLQSAPYSIPADRLKP